MHLKNHACNSSIRAIDYSVTVTAGAREIANDNIAFRWRHHAEEIRSNQENDEMFQRHHKTIITFR